MPTAFAVIALVALTHGSTPSERQALVAMYTGMGGPSWAFTTAHPMSNWTAFVASPSTVEPCSLALLGIGCTNATGSVTYVMRVFVVDEKCAAGCCP